MMRELEAMQAIAQALEGLDEEEVNRVLNWALDKFDIPVSEERYRKHRGENRRDEGKEHTSFDTVADFFYKSSPGTDAEKALTIGYWLQEIEGQSDFDSYSVNSELKQLGHQIGNITRAFNQLMNKKPQLAVQTQKTGNTKQARRKYKLTAAGVKYLETLIRDEEDD